MSEEIVVNRVIRLHPAKLTYGKYLWWYGVDYGKYLWWYGVD